MDRGRPRYNNRSIGAPVRRVEGTSSVERNAFEGLPTGVMASEAPATLEQAEIVALREQALGQACMFKILRLEQVNVLSKVRVYAFRTSSQINGWLN